MGKFACKVSFFAEAGGMKILARVVRKIVRVGALGAPVA